MGEEDEYLIYRFGTADSIEFQYPLIPDSSSWKLFEYELYFRGGGPGKLGTGLSQLPFQ
ncbi:MAG: hypothetical protein K8S24_10315 [Candidatus Aegiribacteria sp.]|nr:hypothetical protein [Candidatus Aegiribacteria sp.]